MMRMATFVNCEKDKEIRISVPKMQTVGMTLPLIEMAVALTQLRTPPTSPP